MNLHEDPAYLRNPILANTLDICSERSTVIESLMEAIDLQRRRAAEVLLYRFGFFRLPFSHNRLVDGYNLHVWNEELPRDHFPHTHIFELKSRVLTGSLVDHAWIVQKDAQGIFRCVTPEYDGAVTRDREIPGTFYAEIAQSRPIKTDEVYAVAKGAFHSTEIAEDNTVTLMRKSCVDPQIAPINVVPIHRKPEPSFDLKRISQVDAWDALEKALQKLL